MIPTPPMFPQPQVAGTPTQSQFQPISTPDPGPPNWFDYYHQNYGQMDLPNHMYDGLREKFFGDHIGPWAMSQGQAIGPLHESFMKQTERENRTESPRTGLVVKSAISGFLAPLKVFGGESSQIARNAELAEREATLAAAREGINPTWYKMAGDMAGTLPYWAVGMGGAGMIAEGASLTVGAAKALRVATGALIQGSYDAAKAPDGQRVTQGFQGALAGGAIVGGFELAGPLWKYLKAVGGVSEESAKAIESVAKGITSPAEHELASKALVEDSGLSDRIVEWGKAQQAGAKASGMPGVTDVAPPTGEATVGVLTVDGNLYTMPSRGEVPQYLVDHLKAGASLEGVSGDPVVMQKLLKGIEEAHPEAFSIDGKPNDTIQPARTPEDYDKWWREQPLTHAMEETEYEKMWHTMDTTMGEAKGMEELGQPVQFGQNEVPIEGTRGKIKFRGVSMEDVPPSEAPMWEGKDKPLYTRLMGGGEDVEKPLIGHQSLGIEHGTLPGDKPVVGFSPNLSRKQAPGIVHHEMIHSHASYLDLHGVISEAADTQISRAIYNGAIKGVMEYPAEHIPEEVFAYTSSAIRTGDARLLTKYAEADSGKESVLNWYTDAANKIREHIATLPDSLHKRTLERRLNYTVAQASKQLEDFRRPFSQTHEIDYDSSAGLHSAEDLKTGDVQWAPSRDDLLTAMEPHQEPLNTPELVDTSNLPPFPRYAADLGGHTTARAPITTDPPPPANMGWEALKFFWKPFYDWVGDVGQKFGRQDLVAAFEKVRDAQNEKFILAHPYTVSLNETLYKHKMSRQTDFYKYFEAKSPEARQRVAEEAKFSTTEWAHINRYEDEVFNKLPGFREYVQDTLPEMKVNKYDVETRFPRYLDTEEDNSAMIGRLMRRGQLDPRDENLLRVTSTYLQGHAFHEAVEPAVKAAEKLVEEQAADGTYTFDILRPLLKRQIQYYRGVPDWSQKVVMSAVDSAVQNINKGLASVNNHLPDSMQLPTMREGPRDVLGKFIMFNYAGALALRPAVPIRDTLSLFLTSYPLLGEEYLWKGMRKAMTYVGEGGKESDAFQIAQHSGWLMNKMNLPEMIAAGGELQRGPVSDWTHKAMSVMTFSENSKRLVAGWGFAEKIGDAVEGFARHGDQKKFLSESGLWFLNQGRRDLRLGEAAALTAEPGALREWALKAAKDMVDATNWDFSSGAAPGFYKYQLGRLFGQYGQWPMNYIEYLRKFITQIPTEYRQDAILGLTRAGIAHGSILAAAHGVGIDAAQWTFTQPMAYGGGPMFTAVTQIPNTMDFQSYQGAQARRDVIRPIWPGMIPGSNEMHNIWRAVSEDKPDAWVRILGFIPTKETKQ